MRKLHAVPEPEPEATPIPRKRRTPLSAARRAAQARVNAATIGERQAGDLREDPSYLGALLSTGDRYRVKISSGSLPSPASK